MKSLECTLDLYAPTRQQGSTPVNRSLGTRQITAFYKLHPLRALLIRREFALSPKVQSTRLTQVSQRQRPEPQHWHERMCTVACFSSLAHTSAQCPDTCRWSSCCFLKFSQTPGLCHRLGVLYLYALIQIYAS